MGWRYQRRSVLTQCSETRTFWWQHGSDVEWDVAENKDCVLVQGETTIVPSPEMRRAYGMQVRKAAPSGVVRQAAQPAQPVRQDTCLPLSTWVKKHCWAVLLDPADILRLSYPCCPWLPFPQLLWHYLLALALRVRQGPRLSYWDGNAPCLSLPAAHLMLLNSLWLTFFTLALPCFSLLYSLQQPFLILLSSHSQFEESFWWFWMTVCPLSAFPGLFIYWTRQQ